MREIDMRAIDRLCEHVYDKADAVLLNRYTKKALFLGGGRGLRDGATTR